MQKGQLVMRFPLNSKAIVHAQLPFLHVASPKPSGEVDRPGRLQYYDNRWKDHQLAAEGQLFKPIAATEQRDYETRKHSTTDKHQYREKPSGEVDRPGRLQYYDNRWKDHQNL
jgi:hypothetical protein